MRLSEFTSDYVYVYILIDLRMHGLQYYKTKTGVGDVLQFGRACLSCMRYDTQDWLGQVAGSQVISAHRRCGQASHNFKSP